MSKRSVDEVELATQILPAKGLLESLIRALSVVEETRHDKGLRHPIINVLTIAVLGCMCGCDDAEALEYWGELPAPGMRRVRSSPAAGGTGAKRSPEKPGRRLQGGEAPTDETAANDGPSLITPVSRETAFGKLRKSGPCHSLNAPGQRKRRASVLCDHPRGCV
jgi:hypothetical protein